LRSVCILGPVSSLRTRTSTIVFGADRATITVVQEPCDGDAIGFDRIVRLELVEPAAAGSIRAVMQAGGDIAG
jgi:hypothetical protein